MSNEPNMKDGHSGNDMKVKKTKAPLDKNPLPADKGKKEKDGKKDRK